MNSSLLHIYDQYIYALVALGGTALGVALVQWFIQYSLWSGWAHSLHGVVAPFINIIGVLFSLTLAFLANDTWSAHDRATNAVFREADALRSLVTLSDTLPEPLRTQARAATHDYAQASAAEWPMLARRESSAQVPVQADRLLKLMASQALAQSTTSNLQALMLGKVSEIRAQRDLRIGLSQTHVNPFKWLGMAFLGLITLLSLAAVHVDRPRAALVAMLLFAFAAAPTAAIVLMQGNPFEHMAPVSSAPILTAVQGL